MKRACISVVVALTLLLCFSTTASASGGRIAVTYNNGGSINVLSAVKMEGNVIYVEDDTKVEIVAVPNDGYSVAGVYLNDQSMNISGSGPQTILVAPKGTSVTLRITFTRSENMGGYTQPEQSAPSTVPEDTDTTAQPPTIPPSEPPPEQAKETPPPSAAVPESDNTETPPADAPADQPDDAPDESAGEPSSEPDEGMDLQPTPTVPYTPNPSQQTHAVISTEINNGGVGGLAAPMRDTVNAERITTIAIVACSLAVSLVITVIIIRKGNQR